MSFFGMVISAVCAIAEKVIPVAVAWVTRTLDDIFGGEDVAAKKRRSETIDATAVRVREINEETDDLARKKARDKKLNSYDEHRLDELRTARKQEWERMQKAKAAHSANSLLEKEDTLVEVPLSDVEIGSNLGLLTTKTCPQCGGTMGIRHGAFDVNTQRHKFLWSCENTLRRGCRRIHIDLRKEAAEYKVVRAANPDLDMSSQEQKRVWEDKKLAASSHARIRQHMGEDDTDILCPHHASPMRLLEARSAGGRLFNSYEWVCLHVDEDSGEACRYKVPLTSEAQLSTALKRYEGRGLL